MTTGSRSHPLRRAGAAFAAAATLLVLSGVTAADAGARPLPRLACATVLNADGYDTDQDVTLNVPAPGVLANDSTCFTGDAIKLTDPANGTVTLNGDGSFSYVPDGGFHGTDSFTYGYNVEVPSGRSARAVVLPTATVTIDVAPTCVENLADDFYSTDYQTAVSDGDPGVFVNDDICTEFFDGFDVVDPPSHGSVTPTGGGGFTYTPNAGYSGNDVFTYELHLVEDHAPRRAAREVVARTVAAVNIAIRPPRMDTTTTTSAPPVFIPDPTTTTSTTAPEETTTTVEEPTTTLEPTTIVETTTTELGVIGTDANQGTSGGALARTGAELAPIGLAGGAMVALGLAVAAESRRRRRSNA